MVSLKKIATECGVSITAVHYALNSPHRVSKEVRANILQTAHQLGYYKQKSTRDLTIGLVCEHFFNYFTGEYYDRIILGIQQRLGKLGIRFQIFDGLGVDYPQVSHINGFLVVGRSSPQTLKQLAEFGIPALLAGHPVRQDNLPAVFFDSAPAAADLLDYVISCGHRQIAFINGEPDADDVIWQQNLDAYRKVLDRNGLETPLNEVFQVRYDNMQTVEIAWNKILGHRTPFTCIICSDDLLAYFCYLNATKYRISIPDRISVTGFDHINLPRFLKPPHPRLTTVHVDRESLGSKAVDLLLEHLRRPLTTRWHTLPARLEVGDSVARIIPDQATKF